MSRPLIGLADLITALHVLGVDHDRTRESVSRILGLEGGVSVESPGSPKSKAGTETTHGRAADTPDAALALDTAAADAPIATDLVPLPREAAPSAVRLGSALREARPTGDVEVEPLFDPRWSRSLVAGIARTESAQGAIDVGALVDRVAKAQPVRSLPRGPAPTVRRGVQVLVDVSETMLPFSRDQERLVKRLLDLVGSERVEVVRFEGCPRLRRAGADPDQGDWYDLPRPGTPVVALTDLGAGRTLPGSQRATAEDWIAIATAIHHAGSRMVALVPYPVTRVAREIRRVVSVVTWDRSTRPSAVLKATRGTGIAAR